MESVDKQRHNKQMDYMEKALSETTAERDEVMARISQLKRKLEELQCNQMQIEQRLVDRNEKLKVWANVLTIFKIAPRRFICRDCANTVSHNRARK